MRHLSTILNGLAFLWVSGATIYLLVAAGRKGVSATSASSGSEEVVGHLGVALVSPNGVWMVGLLVIVTLGASLPLGVALTYPDGHRPVTWATGLLVLGFAMVSGFSVGLMYLPSAVLLLASAATIRVRADRKPIL